VLATVLAAVLALGCSDAPSHGRSAHASEAARSAVDVSHWSDVVTDVEVARWRDAGVRHVIAGTQNARITRQQLAMAYDGGMTLDAYVYIHFTVDLVEQVHRALEVVAGLAVGRLWLDLEADPAGAGPIALQARIGDALAACAARSVDCGIYTGKGWWNGAMAGSQAFAEVPLWFAHYDGNPDLGTWESTNDRFGGWAEPTGKQYEANVDLGGVNVDRDRMLVPQPVRDAPPLEPAAPGDLPAPRDLYPDAANGDDLHIEAAEVRILWRSVPGATGYDVEVRRFVGGACEARVSLHAVDNARRILLPVSDVVYLWRARAHDDSGQPGAWSHWARFARGYADDWPPDGCGEAGMPEEEPPAPPEPTPEEPPQEPKDPPEPPPATSDVPQPTSPAEGATVTATPVTLGATSVPGAGKYELAVEFFSATKGAYVPYYTFASTTPSKAFWPSGSTSSGAPFRFRVRAHKNGVWGAFSGLRSFVFQP
jgi:GH25 family lysozyme M1 (1,4-beta-N-acetylmuramidase)